ncbi:Crp/Fnr family transcriptional regulator [Massilia niastensis]|uniref:Crp/Fnr family transcriptional regulator n=1 Tax=Massilia niastensis TaxID=544911 RepID=UPI0003A6B7C6|nr:Crp/Fnr family transcriptional regulator [Massilia niastensis]
MMSCAQTKEFIASSLWGRGLTGEELQRVQSETSELTVQAGQTVCHRGMLSEYWYGVVDGLVKVSNVTRAGRTTSLIGIPAGGWFGEGSVLKNELRPYDVVALRTSRLALVPATTFHWLLGTSFPFNRFLIDQLNARLAQFVIRLEHFRSSTPERHVAHCLAELFNTQLYPGTATRLQISQEEVAFLAGVSRQLVCRTLHRLEEAGVLQSSYGSLRILDIQALRAFASEGDSD